MTDLESLLCGTLIIWEIENIFKNKIILVINYYSPQQDDIKLQDVDLLVIIVLMLQYINKT